MKATCDDCGFKQDIDDIETGLGDIRHLMERIEPGGTVPAGECPKCQALMYPDSGRDTSIIGKALIKVNDAVRHAANEMGFRGGKDGNKAGKALLEAWDEVCKAVESKAEIPARIRAITLYPDGSGLVMAIDDGALEDAIREWIPLDDELARTSGQEPEAWLPFSEFLESKGITVLDDIEPENVDSFRKKT